MQEKPIRFGTGGWRAVIGSDFIESNIRRTAEGICALMCEEGRTDKPVIIGYDHRFGHNRAEGFADYVAYGREMGMEVVQNPVFKMEGVNVSSTVCRRHVAAGEMEAASRCLGYPYRMGGRVVAGFQEGRKLGFPTANIQLADPRRLVPA